MGHIRRCRTIAHYLAETFPKLKVLIVSGSPIIASFDFKTRVDFVRIPGIIKLRNGDYVSLQSHGSVQETTHLRSSLIQETALQFAPDMFIVDKEPLGLRGELAGTLEALKRRGTQLVLGLRDVMDEPHVLQKEWERKNAFNAIEQLYDDLWVYGLRAVYDPLQKLTVSEQVRNKTQFVGYLHRKQTAARPTQRVDDLHERILVTTGGGGDGESLVEWVLRAYESSSDALPPALIMQGPFMRAEARHEFEDRAKRISKLRVMTFEPRMEHFMAQCLAVVSMGGYNTFCEILSFDKRALIIPRRVPRLEQFIRAEAAQKLGLVHQLAQPADDEIGPTEQMVAALRGLLTQDSPSRFAPPGLLDGLPNVAKWCGDRLHLRRSK